MADLLVKHLKEKAGKHSALSLLASQWDFDKKLIPKALQSIGGLFPHYSRHDESHSKQILINIERLLGDNIRLLSATDTWLILEAAYWHDIGMVVPHADLQKAIADAYRKGFLGKNIFGSGRDFEVYWHGGAGAYEVGEESALMESLEGKRGVPRIRPPFPAVVGLWGGPTVINNAETLASVPHIVLGGAEWFANLGTPKNGGTRLFCLGGHLNKPGVYELPMGYNLRKMIYDVGGGIPNGRKLKAVVPGGSSCPLLTESEIDVPMDFDSLMKIGSMLGSGGLVVVDDSTCMVKFALRIMKFYQHESCGWCIPCREGTDWLKKTLLRFHAGGGIKKDIDNILYLSENMLGRTFCPLGDAAALPTISIVKKFRKEFEDHLEGRPCPFEKAGAVVRLPVFA